jgi:hypothetical protein
VTKKAADGMIVTENWTLDTQSSAADGERTLTPLRSTDNLRHTTPPQPIAFRIDTTPPEVVRYG